MTKTRRLFQVIDFDRVLFDTEKFAHALTNELRRTEPEVADSLDAAVETAYANEETFFLLRYLRSYMGNTAFENLVALVAKNMGGGESFLMPDACKRLQAADTFTGLRPSIGILTYGDEIDQRMKMALAGVLDIPVIISPTPDKAEILRQWLQPGGGFLLPEEFGGGTVDRLTLEDDKVRAFHDLPHNVQGIIVTARPIAREVVPVGVSVVTTLAESMKLLQK